MYGDARIKGYRYCLPLETLVALYYKAFILTVGIIGVDSLMLGTCVLLEIPSMLKLVQYFQSLCSRRNEDIYMSLKVYILPTLKLIFAQTVLNTGSSISNVHGLYQYSCKQCCAIAVYAMCYSLLLIHVNNGLQELYLPLLVTGIHCTM